MKKDKKTKGKSCGCGPKPVKSSPQPKIPVDKTRNL